MPTSRFHGGRPEMSLSADQHAAAVGVVEAGDQPQQRGLAAAGGSEQREELAGADIEIDRLQHVIVAIGQVDLFDPDADGRQAARWLLDRWRAWASMSLPCGWRGRARSRNATGWCRRRPAPRR